MHLHLCEAEPLVLLVVYLAEVLAYRLLGSVVVVVVDVVAEAWLTVLVFEF